MSCPTKGTCKYIPKEVLKLTKTSKSVSRAKWGNKNLPLTVISIGAVAATEEEAREKAQQLFSAMAIHTVLGPASYFNQKNFEHIWEQEMLRLRNPFSQSLEGKTSSLKSSTQKKVPQTRGSSRQYIFIYRTTVIIFKKIFRLILTCCSWILFPTAGILV